MATILRTCDGDLLDTICYSHYGRMAGTVEAVYAANPGLAALVQPFAEGVIVRLPDLPVPRNDVLQLWS